MQSETNPTGEGCWLRTQPREHPAGPSVSVDFEPKGVRGRRCLRVPAEQKRQRTGGTARFWVENEQRGGSRPSMPAEGTLEKPGHHPQDAS